MSEPAQPARDLKLRLHNLEGKFSAVALSGGGRWKMTASLLRTSLALLFLGLFGALEATISCRNEEGGAVDW